MALGQMPMTLQRHPPIPPSKPMTKTFMQNIVEGGLQDSDTDSGICADSDQSSPRQAPPNSFYQHTHSVSPAGVYRSLLDDRRDYRTPNSARKLFSADSGSRRLPARPPQQRPKTYRVRFADQVDSGASTSSSGSEPSPKNSDTVPAPAAQSFYSKVGSNPNSLNNNHSSPYISKETISQRRRNDSLPRPRRVSVGYSVEDVESLPEPPSYAVAVQRLRSMDQRPKESVRDSVIRQNVNDTLNRTFRNRSSSLPRGNLTPLYSTIDRSSGLDYQMNRVMGEQLLGSVDNLRMMSDDYGEDTLRRRRLPPAPLRGSSAHIPDSIDAERESLRQPAYMRQRRMRNRVPTLTRRSASAGRYPEDYADDYQYTQSRPVADGGAVRAQLVALDQRGFRTVLVEKTQPGPFGFYIATGVMNGQRGIFISRVSLPSLTPMLSVGDEILYVDDELVKGRSLEYVQSLIAGKIAVVIVLLPAIGPALC